MNIDSPYRIIILTKPVEAPYLVKFVRTQNPLLDVETAFSQEELRQKIGGQGAHTRLISFNSEIIIPKSILDGLGPIPYNIHPGPPDYPGSYPLNYALKNGAENYGVTGHEIWEKVDAGPIVYVEQIAIEPDMLLHELSAMAYTMAVKAFSVIAIHCAKSAAPMAHLNARWSGQKSTRKGYQQLCRVPANASPEEIAFLKRICGDDLDDGSPVKNSA
jgi:Formyl transferase